MIKFEATDKWYKDSAENETSISTISAGHHDDEREKFIADRKTPYSEIQSIEVGDEFVTYTEKYDLHHPMCPIVRIEIDERTLVSFSEIKKVPKYHFELLFGGLKDE